MLSRDEHEKSFITLVPGLFVQIHCCPGVGCSKFTMLLVNVSLKLQR